MFCQKLYLVYFSGFAAASTSHSWVKVEKEIPLKEGWNEIALLSSTVGLQVHYKKQVFISVFASVVLEQFMCFLWIMCHLAELWCFFGKRWSWFTGSSSGNRTCIGKSYSEQHGMVL